MKRIRIGKDISMRWEITTDGVAIPLDGRDLTVEIKSPAGIENNIPYRIDGNILIMTYYGYEQKRTGEYSITLWEKKGKPGQNVVDVIRAFKLVETSQEEDDFVGGDLQIESVDLGTENFDILTEGGYRAINIDTLQEEALEDSVNIKGKTYSNESFTITLPKANLDSAGVMSASDVRTLKEHADSIARIKTSCEENAADIERVSNVVDTHESRLGGIDAEISSLNTEVSTLQSKVDENTTSISQINTELDNKNDEIAQINTTLEEHTKSINANITTDRIENGAVTSEKIATSAFDDTLSVSGKIAPADVVGEKLAELESETIASVTPYTDNYAMVNESGFISKREDCVISDFIEVSENDTLAWSSGIGHKEAFVYLAQYDADKNITSSIWVSIPSIREIPVREGTKYVRASFKKSSDAYLKDGKGNYLFAYNDVSKALQNIGITTDVEHEILPSSYAEEVGYRTSQQYINLRWTPKFPVPMQGGANYFPANEERQGILYAEGAYQDKRVGYDVSLKTFMTAINNPYSLIYTENCAASYSKSAYGVQYKGDANSGAYMGFVCNNFVFRTLGEKIPYSSVEIATWCVEKGLTEKIYDQSSHGLKLMDILQISGHCRVVTRLWANSRNVVTKVQVSEAVGSGSTNVIYTAEQFDKWLKSSGYAIYRYRDLYKNIYYEKSPFVVVEDEVAEPYEYNNDICTFAGDYASFGEGSLLHINYTKGNYNIMEIYKNDILIESVVLSSDENTHDVDLTNKGYTYGKYKARLTNGTEHSDYTYFEILNVELSKNGNLFTFSSANAKPIYWGWFAMNGWAFQKHILTESDLAKGSVDYSQYQTSDGHPYLKIYVQGEYGRIAKIG